MSASRLINNISDRLTKVDAMVECAFMACEALPDEHGSALATVLAAAQAELDQAKIESINLLVEVQHAQGPEAAPAAATTAPPMATPDSIGPGSMLNLWGALDDARGGAALLDMALGEFMRNEADDKMRRVYGIKEAMGYLIFILTDDQVRALRQSILVTRDAIGKAWTPFVAIHPIAEEDADA